MTLLLLFTLTAVGFAFICAAAALSRRGLFFALLAYLATVPMMASAGRLDTIISATTPGVLDLIGVALTGIIGWAATMAR